ncbi:uncharacterized protein [Lepeophtheirus salmonis]
MFFIQVIAESPRRQYSSPEAFKPIGALVNCFLPQQVRNVDKALLSSSKNNMVIDEDRFYNGRPILEHFTKTARINHNNFSKKDENGKIPDLKEVISQLSPNEARTLRRLSYLAGFDKRKTSNQSGDSVFPNEEGPLSTFRRFSSPNMRKLSSISNKLGNISVSFHQNHNNSASSKNMIVPNSSNNKTFDLQQQLKSTQTHRLHALTPIPSKLSLHKETLDEAISACQEDMDPSTPSSLSPTCQTSSSTNINTPVHHGHSRIRHNPHCAVHGEDILDQSLIRNTSWPSEFLLLPPPIPSVPNKDAAVNTESNQLNSIVIPTIPLHPGYLCPCQLMLVKRTAVDGSSTRQCIEESLSGTTIVQSGGNRLYRHMEEEGEDEVDGGDEEEDDEDATAEGDSEINTGKDISFSAKESLYRS